MTRRTPSSTRSIDSLGTRSSLDTPKGPATFFSLQALSRNGQATSSRAHIDRLPFSIKVLLEAMLRNEDGEQITQDDLERMLAYDPKNPVGVEIPFKPARVILQDFTGVPAVVDLAAMRSAIARLGGDPAQINPQIPVDLVIDHSVQVDAYNSAEALQRNAEMEFSRNRERYGFLRWGQQAFDNFKVIPPASGIVHQVNLEYLAKVVQRDQVGDEALIYPDSLVGTDSHTTMVNGLGVLGWGVGGIEAEAIMLGQPIYMLTPEVIGMNIVGRLPEGATATDLTLRVTELLRAQGVVGKFVEFYGEGLSGLTLADRATMANMAPEYGATMGFFPVDDETLRYLRGTGRPADLVDLVERYCKEQGLFRSPDMPDPDFAATVTLELDSVEPSLAGPKRPQDRIPLSKMKRGWEKSLTDGTDQRGFAITGDQIGKQAQVTHQDGQQDTLAHGSVVIAAITSCTNTSNPAVMIGAGVLAKKAVEAGLSSRKTVKASLAPGSRVVTSYLDRAGLTPFLEQLGFFTVGYGCTTCIGNSGPLDPPIAQAIVDQDLVAASVLSGNRNFEGRVNPHTRANYLASPPLVVAYALAGTVDINLLEESIGHGRDNREVFLRDIWPTSEEISAHLDAANDPQVFRSIYDSITSHNDDWNRIPVEGESLYGWDADSTYIQQPPFFTDMTRQVPSIGPIEDAHVLVRVGDSVTTDHISPAGAIPADSPAADYLKRQKVQPEDFNSFGSRRGNDRVMTRGTFGNIRLRNQLAPGTEGGWTTYIPTHDVIPIYEASQRYAQAGRPTIVLAGSDYGMGSSRDWAAKGTFLLGVRAVIAESFERIHRSNLVGMGVLPLEFAAGQDAHSLGLTGDERFTIELDDGLQPRQEVMVQCIDENNQTRSFSTTCRIDTPIEVDYYRNGGILQTVLRQLLPPTAPEAPQ